MRSSYPTRKWSHPEGYKYLAPWTNAVLLRFLIRKFTEGLPRSEYRTKTQLDDAGRSVISNIEEGFKRPTTREYLDFIGFSQGSLEEVKGLFRQVHQDGFLVSRPGSFLADIGIDLREFKGKLEEIKGNSPLNVSLNILYSPLKSLKGADLTLQMMMELINKTDYLLRQLVKSLENSITKEDVLSPYDRWLGRQMEQRRDEEKDFDEELKRIVERAKSEKGEPR